MSILTEIADSDAESEGDVGIDSAPSLPVQPSPTRQNDDSSGPVLDLGVNFSDFLSQSNGYPMDAPQSTANSGPGAKRSHSEIPKAGYLGGSQSRKRNRQNTYGSSRCMRSSQSDLFLEDTQRPAGAENKAVLDRNTNGNTCASDERDESTNHEPKQTEDGLLGDQGHSFTNNRDRNGPSARSVSSGAIDYLKEYVQMSPGRVSTTRSLMGSYEPINLDYTRGAGGLDINANPFVDNFVPLVASQGEALEQHVVGEIFRSRPDHIDGSPPSPYTQDGYPHAKELPHEQYQRMTGFDPQSPARLTSGRSKSYVDPAVLVLNPLNDGRAQPGNILPSKRKRRRTDDLGSSLLVTESEQPIEAHPRPETPGLSDSRSEKLTKKRGRKSKAQLVERSTVFIESGDRLRTSEGDQASTHQDPSPLKTSSGEVHLDDEFAIGLPKENYKPRPSRSRSKRIGEEAGLPPTNPLKEPVSSPEKSISTPIPKSIQNEQAEETKEPEDTPLTKIKKEARKKNKMKRAKTSAAALLKRSDKMISDGEEDVIWVETAPATVKMKVPDQPEMKREPTPPNELTKEEDKENHSDNAVADSETEDTYQEQAYSEQKVTVEIPQKDGNTDASGPKKRGRKRKAAPPTTTEAPEEPENIPTKPDVASKSQKQRQSSRQPLQEKDTNTNITKPHTSDPRHSPADPPEKASESVHQPTSPALSEPPLSTPIKAKEPLQDGGAGQEAKEKGKGKEKEKGPTKHSPINPSGGKIRYRVGLSKRASIPPLLKIVRK